MTTTSTSTSTRGRLMALATEMHDQRVAGMSLAEIADAHRCSREWVRQVLIAEYGTASLGPWETTDPDSSYRQRVRQERKDALAAYRDEVLERIRSGETLTRTMIVQNAPVAVTTTHEVLGEMEWIVPRKTLQEVQETPADRALDDVRTVWKRECAPRPMSVARYEKSRDPGMLSASRLVQRWGTWSSVCSEAGLPCHTRPHTYAERTLTVDTALDWVAAYLSRRQKNANANAFDAWSREVGGPSLGTLRSVVGPWNTLRGRGIARLLEWWTTSGEPIETFPLPTPTRVEVDESRVAVWRRQREAGVPVRVIAAESRVSPGVVYYHLKSDKHLSASEETA